MMEEFLYRRLDRVASRQRRVSLGLSLALAWGGVAVVGLVLLGLQRQMGWSLRWSWVVLAVLGVAVSLALVIRSRRRFKPDYRSLAVKIEQAHPDLQGVLLTAVQQIRAEGKDPGYLQYRVIQTAVTRSSESDWRDVVPRSRLAWSYLAQVSALLLMVAVIFQLSLASKARGTPRAPMAGLTVTPGDTTLERGESLVVLARFGDALPTAVELVVDEPNVATRKLPLVKSLADPLFGGSVPEVQSDLRYHLEYGGKRSPDYKVTVFEHPRLERANVQLTFPQYTTQPAKRIDDTRRVSAVEGTQLDLSLQLNKPVKSAKLVARDKAKTVIDLQVAPGKATASLPPFTLVASQTYDLKLVDAEGRANKAATPFIIDVVPNRPPEIKLTSPRGDTRPSALEEVAFDGTIWDDFGAPAYGLAYTLAGGETKFIELGKETPAREKRGFSHLLRLEELGVQPDQFLSWYVWADDVGPDGNVRRTSGDLYFAEVRPFDEVFRESQDMMSQEQEQQAQMGQSTQSRKLTELQKQIISATWRLQRESLSDKYPDDASVVRQSQEQALAQANEAKEDAKAPQAQALWLTVTRHMEQASDRLKEATKSKPLLAQALTAEQAAYQALMKLQQREYNVSRSRSRGGGGGGQQGNQRQLDQLDLAQAENRYETQRQATPPQSPERREQSQVMNRLQELARRQGDLNERLKELQAALQEAPSEKQKEEIRRQLKRLQDEQRQMLADVDELKQRMDRPENQAQMTEQRQQLDQTRDQLQQAADAAGAGAVAQAVASGTRAQRQLQEMRDELRKQNSSQFSEDLRQMRADARELSRQQEQIARRLGTQEAEANQRKSLGGSVQDKDILDELAQQKERMKGIVERATEVSQQAENSEPLLSRQLYDSIRKLSQDDVKNVKDFRHDLLDQGVLTRDLYNRMQKAESSEEPGKSIDLTADMLRAGLKSQAGLAEQRARAGIEDLKRGVEKAAGSVLGDDAEALKLAQSEIDAVTEQLEREMAQAQGQEKGAGEKADPAGQKGLGQSGPGGQRMAGNQGEASAAGEQGQPGQGETDNDPGRSGETASPLAGGGREAEGSQPGEAGQGERGKGERGKGLANRDARPGQGRNPGASGTAGEGQSPGSSATDSSEGGSSNSPGGAGQMANNDANSATGRAGANGADNRGLSPSERFRRATAPRQLTGGGPDTRGGNDRAGFDIGGAFNDGRGGANWAGGAEWLGGQWRGPILGDNFGPWADRLRNVEEVLDDAALREAVAAARERARLMRVDYRRDQKKPDWAVVKLEVLKPLNEVRNRIAEELARRDSKDSLVPIDRDPVPTRFTDSVSKYYEALGKDKPGSQ